MKKLFAVVLFVMLSVSSICNAFTLDKERWVKVAENEKDEAYVDVITLTYIRNSIYDKANVWVCFFDKVNKTYMVSDNVFDFNENTTQGKQIICYDENGELLTQLSRETKPERTVPGSMGEGIFLVVKNHRPE